MDIQEMVKNALEDYDIGSKIEEAIEKCVEKMVNDQMEDIECIVEDEMYDYRDGIAEYVNDEVRRMVKDIMPF